MGVTRVVYTVGRVDTGIAGVKDAESMTAKKPVTHRLKTKLGLEVSGLVVYSLLSPFLEAYESGV